MKPPVRIQIGSRSYAVAVDRAAIDRVSLADYKEQLDGNTDHARQKIVLNPMMEADYFAEVLLHEVLHGVCSVTDLYSDLGHDTEEKVVSKVAPLLLDTLRRNPKLVSFLLGGGS